MAVSALFSDIGVLIDKRPLVLHVATGTKCFGGNTLKVFPVGRVVWVVTVGTGHFMLWNRMVGKLGELHLDLHMAAGTELFLFVTADFLLWTFMQFVAIKAADIIK